MPIIDLSAFPTFTAINLLADGGYDRNNRVIPNCCSVVLTWTLEDGKIAHNVTYGTVSAGFSPTPVIADNILTALVSGAGWTTLAGFIATTTRLSAIWLRDMRAKDQPFVKSVGTGALGTSAGTTLPNEVAAVITLQTALTGRANRGRMYIPGMASNALGAGNVIAAAAVTALQTWAGSNVGNAYNAQGLPMAIGHFHRLAYTTPKGTQIPERQAGTVPVTQLVVRDNHWDTQRRRGLK